MRLGASGPVAVSALVLCLAACWPSAGCERGPGRHAPGAPPGVSFTPRLGPAAEPGASSSQARRDLSADERRGGHALARHVGKSDEDLLARLLREPRISAASTYPDRATAERVVGETLEREVARLERWRARQGPRPNLALDYEGTPAVVIGRSLRRGRDRAEQCHDAVVVLRWDDAENEYYVLTSYPEVRR
jgi:hypothetical protein